MRIEFKMEGGFATFPGLSRPIIVEVDALPESEAAEIRRLVTSARLFDRPALVNAPPQGAADYRQYTITIEDGDRQHTVRLADPIEDPSLQALVRFLRGKAKR